MPTSLYDYSLVHGSIPVGYVMMNSSDISTHQSAASSRQLYFQNSNSSNSAIEYRGITLSTAQPSSSHIDYDPTFRVPFFFVDCPIPVTNCKLSYQLPNLIDLNRQNIPGFIADFNKLREANGWGEAASNNMLRAISSNEVFSFFQGLETCSEKLTALVNFKYNKNTAIFHQTKLSCILQNQFQNIRFYKDAINTASQKVGKCLDLPSSTKVLKSNWPSLTDSLKERK